jgi:hypothetical protein
MDAQFFKANPKGQRMSRRIFISMHRPTKRMPWVCNSAALDLAITSVPKNQTSEFCTKQMTNASALHVPVLQQPQDRTAALDHAIRSHPKNRTSELCTATNNKCQCSPYRSAPTTPRKNSSSRSCNNTKASSPSSTASIKTGTRPL